MMRIWLQLLPRNRNSSRFGGCLGLEMIKQLQAGSDDTGKVGDSQKVEGVLRMKVLGDVLMVY